MLPCAVLMTIVNLYSVKVAAKALTWLSSIKFLVFAFIIIIGVWKLIQNSMCTFLYCQIFCLSINYGRLSADNNTV